MNRIRFIALTLSVTAAVAILPFLFIAVLWSVSWEHGAETAEAIVYNSFFLGYRLAAFLAGAAFGIVLLMGQKELQRKFAVGVGIVLGVMFCGVILTWDRWASNLYTAYAEPSLVETFVAVVAGSISAALTLGISLLVKKSATT